VTVARAPYRLDQPYALIVAKRVRGHSATLGHASYGISRVLHNINVQLEARSKSSTARVAEGLSGTQAREGRLLPEA
jgi:tRNA(Met) C34 N-acetyltransferase TmcA